MTSHGVRVLLGPPETLTVAHIIPEDRNLVFPGSPGCRRKLRKRVKATSPPAESSLRNQALAAHCVCRGLVPTQPHGQEEILMKQVVGPRPRPTLSWLAC